MRRMKRNDAMRLSLHLLMVGVLTASLTACGNDDKTLSGPNTTDTPTEQEQTKTTNTPIKSEIITATGTYNGQIDGHSIELDVNGEVTAYQITEDQQSMIDALNEQDTVKLEYYESTSTLEDGSQVTQRILTKIEKATAPEAQVPSAPAATKDIALQIEGMDETRQGTLAESELGYYLYTLPGFELSGEEPGKDVLLWSNDSAYYTRIEPLPSDIDITQLQQAAEDELKEVSKVEDLTSEYTDHHAAFYLLAGDSKLSKSIVLLELGGQLFKCTINIPSGEASEGVAPSMWAILQTIGVKTS